MPFSNNQALVTRELQLKGLVELSTGSQGLVKILHGAARFNPQRAIIHEDLGPSGRARGADVFTPTVG